ncbi:MAG: hypothetical protein OEY21_08865 [Nitrospira sp.]|nr:hypothetical protein [Nitrospira sp.]
MKRHTPARAVSMPARIGSAQRQASRPGSARHPVKDVRRSVGNQTIQRLLHSPCMRGLQAKLNLRLSGDELAPRVDPTEEDVTGIPAESLPSLNTGSAHNQCTACEGGQGDCPKCALAALSNDSVSRRRSLGNQGVLRLMRMPAPSVPAHNGPSVPELPARDHTFTFISRGSYGETTPGFTRPSCVPGAGGAATLVAGSAAPTVTVFANGTYQVRRDDGVVQTATCARLAAGLAATRAHENSHAAGARAGVASANTAQGLPRNFATAAECGTALPAILTAWNATVNAAWANEVAHGPGTNPPTAQTFTQEHAAGTCAFA